MVALGVGVAGLERTVRVADAVAADCEKGAETDAVEEVVAVALSVGVAGLERTVRVADAVAADCEKGAETEAVEEVVAVALSEGESVDVVEYDRRGADDAGHGVARAVNVRPEETTLPSVQSCTTIDVLHSPDHVLALRRPDALGMMMFAEEGFGL